MLVKYFLVNETVNKTSVWSSQAPATLINLDFCLEILGAEQARVTPFVFANFFRGNKIERRIPGHIFTSGTDLHSTPSYAYIHVCPGAFPP